MKDLQQILESLKLYLDYLAQDASCNPKVAQHVQEKNAGTMIVLLWDHLLAREGSSVAIGADVGSAQGTDSDSNDSNDHCVDGRSNNRGSARHSKVPY